jgi:rhodanese-related sulfurtransferase
MIWILAILCIAVCGWYWYEGRWDRQLFASEAGRVCANVRPHEAILFLEAHPETQVLDVRDDDEFCLGALPGAVNFSIGDDAFAQKSRAAGTQDPLLVARIEEEVQQMKKIQGIAQKVFVIPFSVIPLIGLKALQQLSNDPL